ncbi:MAG: hypothetical protein ACK5KM_10330 [Hyphomicrobiaceae bacterium]
MAAGWTPGWRQILLGIVALMAIVAVGAPSYAQSTSPYAPTGPIIEAPLPDLTAPEPAVEPGPGNGGKTPAAPVDVQGQGGIVPDAISPEGKEPSLSIEGDALQRLIDAAPDQVSPAPANDAASSNSNAPAEANASGDAFNPDAVRARTAPAPPVYRGSQLAPEISWRVENSFRFFADPGATEMHRKIYETLNGADKRSPVLSAERQLAARFPRGWATKIVDDTCWSAAVNKHRCKDAADYLQPHNHRVVVMLHGVGEASTVECTWSTVPKDSQGKLAPETFLRTCNEPFIIDVPYPQGSEVAVSVGGVELQRASIQVQDLLIVGMGDSFASGEGNPDVPVKFSRERDTTYGDAAKEGTIGGYPARDGSWKQIGDKKFMKGNAQWLDQACHRSLYSHQLRAALQLAIEEPHRAVTYVGLACSGAEITAGLFLRYKGNEWVPNPPELSQISAAAAAQCGKTASEPQDLPEAYHNKGAVPELKGLVLNKCPIERSRKIDLLFLSIGGNDIGFSRLLANAILADQSTLRKLGGWFGQVYGLALAEGQLANLGERYKVLNRAFHYILHIPWNESNRILLTGYPGLALLGDGSQVCPDGTAGMEVVSDFHLSSDKAREGIWVSDKLHRIMKSSAQDYGWTFVEHHRKGFVDRGICAGFTDNAFSIADDLRLPRKVDGRWAPYNPADYPPYSKRQRWFRTPNDAFMTGNFHVAPSILQKALKLNSLSFFQLIVAATYSGAFHPTAEGHAAMADALVEQARSVLERHGQNARSHNQRAGR